MTPLRQRMLQDMELRNFSPRTKEAYVRAVRMLAEFHGKSPSQMRREEVREYLLHLREERRVANSTYIQYLSAIRFLFTVTLERPAFIEAIPFPKTEKKLPVVLSREEMIRFFAGLQSLKYRAILMTSYGRRHNRPHSGSFNGTLAVKVSQRRGNPPALATRSLEIVQILGS